MDPNYVGQTDSTTRESKTSREPTMEHGSMTQVVLDSLYLSTRYGVWKSRRSSPNSYKAWVRVVLPVWSAVRHYESKRANSKASKGALKALAKVKAGKPLNILDQNALHRMERAAQGPAPYRS